jgi:RecJ-like exonuclease
MERYLKVEKQDGEILSVPAKVAICSCCEGHGQVENPAFSNGFTSSEWNDLDDDFKEEYMSGRYDVQCQECKGTGRVLVPDVARLAFSHKRQLVIVRREQREETSAIRAINAEMAAERAFGC